MNAAALLPSLFISHGAPNIALHQSKVRDFMLELATRYRRPDAIVMCSAHFETSGPAVVMDANPGMIYDFGGFEPELYKVQYPAPGNPELAEKIAGLIEAGGFEVARIDNRGYDHGTWAPLSMIYPQADIPVVQVSIDPTQTPQYHYALGRALSGLARENVFFIGSGQITHNLKALFSQGKSSESDNTLKRQIEEFLAWFEVRLDKGQTEELLAYRDLAPHAEANHPTDDHLLPIFFCMGAAGETFKAQKIHDSTTLGIMAMDAYEFKPD